MFIIRNQGFFYTDEYFSAVGEFRQVVKATFASRAEAEAACAKLVRDWVRGFPIDDFISRCGSEDDGCDVDAAYQYMKAQWPDYNPQDREPLPAAASDVQIDELVKISKIRFAEVYEVEQGSQAHADEDEDDDDRGDDLYFGPTRVQLRAPKKAAPKKAAPKKATKADGKKSIASATTKKEAAEPAKQKTKWFSFLRKKG